AKRASHAAYNTPFACAGRRCISSKCRRGTTDLLLCARVSHGGRNLEGDDDVVIAGRTGYSVANGPEQLICCARDACKGCIRIRRVVKRTTRAKHDRPLAYTDYRGVGSEGS